MKKLQKLSSKLSKIVSERYPCYDRISHRNSKQLCNVTSSVRLRLIHGKSPNKRSNACKIVAFFSFSTCTSWFFKFVRKVFLFSIYSLEQWKQKSFNETFLCLSFRTELDKSSSDVAAEGAILNEMLEIVAKRAALRPSDTIPHGIGSSQTVDGLESDVSECCYSPVSKTSWIPIFIQFIVIYACILYFAFGSMSWWLC